MDIAVQKKPRTIKMIKMRYPAPYSRSLTDQRSRRIANRNASQNRSQTHSTLWAYDRNRIKRAKKPASPEVDTKSSYSMPFTRPIPSTNSQPKSILTKRSITQQPREPTNSMALTRPIPSTNIQLRSTSTRKSIPRPPSQKFSSALGFPFRGGSRQPSRPRIRGSDPTAPHLKYGLFRSKKSSNKKPDGLRIASKKRLSDDNNSNMQIMSGALPEPKSWMSTLESSSKKNKKIKNNKKGQITETPPTFVFHTIDPRRTRQLTVSPPTHVDIKPRRMPSFYNSGLRQHSSGRVMSVTKSNYRTQSVTPLQKEHPMKKMK